MKKIISILLVLILVFSLGFTIFLSVSATEVVYFPDINLKLAVYETLNLKPDHFLTPSDMLNLTHLYLSSFNISNVKSLTGLEYATNLKHLDISNNIVTNCDIISDLSNLEYLYFNDCEISNISFVSNLKKLSFIEAKKNKIKDIYHMENLTNLSYVNFSFNEISDASPLINNKNLNQLFLDNNKISDVSFLSSLPSILFLSLNSNSIYDISPMATMTNNTNAQINIDLNENFIDMSLQKNNIIIENLSKLLIIIKINNQLEYTPVDSISIDFFNNENLELNQIIQLSCSVSPANATNKNIIWSSSNPQIAAVSANGLITAKAPGTAIITAKAEDNDKTSSCTVIVLPEKKFIVMRINRPQAIFDNVLGTIDNTGTTPFMHNTKTMLPLRFVGEKMGATVNWDDPTHTITIIKDNVELFLKLGDFTMRKTTINNGINTTEYISLETAPFMHNARTVLPLRAVGEGLGSDIYWHDPLTMIVICNRQMSDEEKEIQVEEGKKFLK